MEWRGSSSNLCQPEPFHAALGEFSDVETIDGKRSLPCTIRGGILTAPILVAGWPGPVPPHHLGRALPRAPRSPRALALPRAVAPAGWTGGEALGGAALFPAETLLVQETGATAGGHARAPRRAGGHLPGGGILGAPGGGGIRGPEVPGAVAVGALRGGGAGAQVVQGGTRGGDRTIVAISA